MGNNDIPGDRREGALLVGCGSTTSPTEWEFLQTGVWKRKAVTSGEGDNPLRESQQPEYMSAIV